MPEPSASRRAAVQRWALITLVFTAIWLLNFSVVMTNEFASRRSFPWRYPFLWEMTGAYAVLALLPGHFLFNPLHLISSHIADDPETADTMIGHLSDVLRVTLRHAPAQEVPLDKEIEFLNAVILRNGEERRLSRRYQDRLLRDLPNS